MQENTAANMGSITLLFVFAHECSYFSQYVNEFVVAISVIVGSIENCVTKKNPDNCFPTWYCEETVENRRIQYCSSLQQAET